MFCCRDASSFQESLYEAASMEPHIGADRSSLVNSVFESNYVSEPFCPSIYFSSNPNNSSALPRLSHASFTDLYSRGTASIYSHATRPDSVIVRANSLSEWPSFKSSRLLSPAYEDFRELEENVVEEKLVEVEKLRLMDQGGAYHCKNCSRRLFDAEHRLGSLGESTYQFTKSENGAILTVPERDRGVFKDIVKCGRCKRAVGVRGETFDAVRNEKLFVINVDCVKLRMKTVM